MRKVIPGLMMSQPWHLLLLSVMVVSSGTTAIAQGDQMGFTTYYFSDSGDNSVITTSFNLAKKLLEKTVFLIDIELDQVTVPPVTAVTGATRPQRKKSEPFEKNRGQVILGIEQGIGPTTTMAGNFYRSQEVDYVSNAFVGTFSQEMFDRNATMTIRGQFNDDKVGKITESGDLINKKKTVYTGAFILSQILSPTTVLDVGYDFVHLRGFQSDPYRQVKVVDGTGATILTDELHPNTRTRHAGSGKISQMIPSIQAALIGSYRFYFDSWKVRSHTGEIKLNKYIVRDLILGIDYRYYTQSAAFFHKDRYIGNEFLDGSYRTADYKLRKFTSNNVGISLTYLLRGLEKAAPDLEFLQNSSVELMYFRYFNDLDFSANIIQAGLKFSI